jgi:HEPN domain-containing protein
VWNAQGNDAAGTLAAFVGAVGLYRLQSLRDHHNREEQTLRGMYATATLNPQEAARLTLDEVLRALGANVETPTTVQPGLAEKIRNSVAEWITFPSRYRRAATVLLIFEA